MGRWRPPRERSSPYITPRGYATLKKESDTIWQHRADVTAALSAAAAEGDRSENAEYIYRKKQLGQIDGRIRYLQKRLPDLKVVDRVGDPDHVYFGAWVTLEKEDETEVRYRIVGSDETDAAKGFISIDSPLARLLLKKGIDDEVTLHLPDQSTLYLIVAIEYVE